MKILSHSQPNATWTWVGRLHIGTAYWKEKSPLLIYVIGTSAGERS